MPRKVKKEAIPIFELDRHYMLVHKEGLEDSNFGHDGTYDLLEDGFGLYSSVRVREKIGPLKSEFYRIGFCRQGSLEVSCGLETFVHRKNTIHFNFPGQLFALCNKSRDMFSHYMLFTADFISSILSLGQMQSSFPFLDPTGIPFLQLSDGEAANMDRLFLLIDQEIRQAHSDRARAVQLLINLVFIEARRSYLRQNLGSKFANQKSASLVVRYKKLVAQHFIRIRSVTEYAARLAVSTKHLNKVIKEETGRPPGAFINEMLIMEIKALLKYSALTASEIAWQLDFTDPSHLTKFFKKHTALTPQQYRDQQAHS